jgi:hypothetical protein
VLRGRKGWSREIIPSDAGPSGAIGSATESSVATRRTSTKRAYRCVKVSTRSITGGGGESDAPGAAA